MGSMSVHWICWNMFLPCPFWDNRLYAQPAKVGVWILAMTLFEDWLSKQYLRKLIRRDVGPEQNIYTSQTACSHAVDNVHRVSVAGMRMLSMMFLCDSIQHFSVNQIRGGYFLGKDWLDVGRSDSASQHHSHLGTSQLPGESGAKGSTKHATWVLLWTGSGTLVTTGAFGRIVTKLLHAHLITWHLRTASSSTAQGGGGSFKDRQL